MTPLHLAVALDGAGWHPAAWREPDAHPAELLTAGYWVDLVQEAQRGLLDLVTFEDDLALQSGDRSADDGRTDRVRGRLDAVQVAARIAPVTQGIGLVPTAVVTHTEPFHLSKAIATLDYVSTGRFFSVKGPSITPRPPQGQPVVAALAHQALPYELVGRSTDLGFVTPTGAADAARIVGEVRSVQAAAGRAEETVHVFGDVVVFLDDDARTARARWERLDETAGEEFRSDALVFAGTAAELADLLASWAEAGLTGFRLRPATLPHDLRQITRALVPELQRRGLFRTGYEASTLRGLLGLPRPANRYATV